MTGFDPSYDIDNDGEVETEIEEYDMDGDGVVDTSVAMTDVDGDGIPDMEAQTTYLDANGDGYLDTYVTDLDYNMDGVFDVEQAGMDVDGDGIVDYNSEMTTMDTDGDGIVDTYTFSEDLDGDGVFDQTTTYQDANEDGYIDVNYIDPNDYQVDPSSDGENFDPKDPTVDYEQVVGEPGEDMEHWHVQERDDSCAVASQGFVLEELLDQDFTEEELREVAAENGWYVDGGENGGTPTDCLGNLLEYYGLNVERSEGATIQDIEDCLNKGGKVIVGVDADEIWYDEEDSVYAPDGANHALEVIGVDYSDPENPMVILNDSGSPDGCGEMVPLDEFVDAWEDSGCLLVEAYK